MIFLNREIDKNLMEELKNTDKITLLVLGDQKHIKRIDNPKVFITYQVNHNSYIYYAPVHCCDSKVLY